MRIKLAAVLHIHLGQPDGPITIIQKRAWDRQLAFAALNIGVLKRVAEGTVRLKQTIAQFN